MLGRLDARTANKDLADANLPSFSLNLGGLKTNFQNVGLSEKDLVALSGGHTIGQAVCTTFRTRIYTDTNINPIFAAKRQ